MPDASLESAIVVVSGDDERSRELVAMIEFLDRGHFVLAGIGVWQRNAGAAGPQAVFVDSRLGAARTAEVLALASQSASFVPIVLLLDERGQTESASLVRAAQPNVPELAAPLSLHGLADVLDRLAAPDSKARSRHGQEPASPGLIGESSQLRDIQALIERVAPTNSTVLITGESGTGKEVIARQIHDLSGRGGKFVALNCGAIPDHLLESELFGHERGAFTGADATRTGRFELADGGTLFLDEIGDMPRNLQVKLLRVLQERAIERIGGTSSIPVDIRLIAATHRDLPERIEEGSFRQDLYYRLSVFPIDIPPLRQRPDDIDPLLNEFADRMRRRHGIGPVFSEDAVQRMRAYAWPGNVRELANLVERLTISCHQRVITASDLPAPIVPSDETSGELEIESVNVLPENGLNLKDYLATVESRAIREALTRSDGVVQGAADILGMGRTTLVEKIKRYGIAG